jgi:hypothetical protein
VNRVSQEKAAVIVWNLLAVLLQIGGFFLALAGFWIIVFDTAGGFALALNFVGPTFLIAGIVAFFTGAAVDIIEARRKERADLLPSPLDRSPAPGVSTPKVPRNFSCPSCGYENDEAGFFCVACNSPLWPAGKPTGPPPPRAMVLHKVGRVLMIRRFKRILVFVILALFISALPATDLVLGYSAVNQSKLVLAFDFSPPISGTNGTLEIAWMLYSAGFDVSFSRGNTTYDVRINNIQQSATSCSDPTPASAHYPWFVHSCLIVVPNVNGTQLNGAAVTVKVTAVASMFVYKQQITRATSVLCDSRCLNPRGSPWFY